MSIVANFDINLRGNTASIDKAADGTSKKMDGVAKAADRSAKQIESRWSRLGTFLRGKIGGALNMLPQGGNLNRAFDAALPAAQGLWDITKGLAETIGGALTGNLEMFVKGLMDVGKGINGVFSAAMNTAKALGSALLNLGMNAIPSIAQLNKLSDKFGVSTEDIATFAHKARLSLDDFDSVFTRFERNAANAQKGAVPNFGGAANALGQKMALPGLDGVANSLTEANQKADRFAIGLQRLGIDKKKFFDASDVERQYMIADAMMNVSSAAERIAISEDLAGRSGHQLLRLWANGSEGIKKARAEADALGLTLTKRQAQDVAGAKGAMATMNKAFAGLGYTVAVAIAPWVTKAAGWVTDIIKKINELRPQIVQMSRWFEYCFDNIAKAAELYFAKALVACVRFVRDSEKEMGGFARFLAALTNVDLVIGAGLMVLDTTIDNLEGKVKGLEKNFNSGWLKFLNQAQQAIVQPAGQGAGSPMSGEKRDNAAVERGSAEAFKIIAGDQGDKMYKKMNESVAVQQKILEELRKKRQYKGPIIYPANL